jgi:hypothetical protein
MAGAFLAIAFATACGARTGSVLDDGETVDRFQGAGGSGGGSGSGDGPCMECRAEDNECRFCLLQGQNRSYRCDVGVPPPESNCMNLLETYQDDDGTSYTCFYCNALD